MLRNTLYLLSPRLCKVLNCDLLFYRHRDDSVKSKVIMRTEQPIKRLELFQKLRAKLCP